MLGRGGRPRLVPDVGGEAERAVSCGLFETPSSTFRKCPSIPGLLSVFILKECRLLSVFIFESVEMTAFVP